MGGGEEGWGGSREKLLVCASKHILKMTLWENLSDLFLNYSSKHMLALFRFSMRNFLTFISSSFHAYHGKFITQVETSTQTASMMTAKLKEM